MSGIAAVAMPTEEVETRSEAAAPPAAEGVKRSCIVQLLPLFKVAAQVEEPVEKLAAEMPMIWKARLASGAPPLLLTVSVEGGLGWPTGCKAKLKASGLGVMVGGCRPVPESVTVWLRTRSATVRVPVAGPDWVGKKKTLMEQLEWPAKEEVQLFDR